MTALRDFDRRLADWLEDGPQTVPDWLVNQAVQQAHATAQLDAEFRWPWQQGPRGVSVGRLVPAAAGAVGALAVVGAFVLGLLFGPTVGDQASPTPGPSETRAPGPLPTTVSRPLRSVEVIEVLPGETPDFFTLIGLTGSSDSVWTSVVTGVSARLVRIDAVTGAAVPVSIPGAGTMLSPPSVDGDVIWTGSTAGLHRVDAGLTDQPVTLPLDFLPAEIGVSSEGLWAAREGGTTLVDTATGATIREVEAGGSSRRIIGAPAAGSLWACLDPLTLALIDPASGGVTGTVDLPADSECHGPVFETVGVDGVEHGVIPYLASVVVDPASATISSSLDVGAWSDAILIEGRIWFLEFVRDRPGFPLALVELDPATRAARQILTFEGALHLNSAFESGYLAVAGEFLWVLADPVSGGTVGERPQVIRLPLSELRAG